MVEGLIQRHAGRGVQTTEGSVSEERDARPRLLAAAVPQAALVRLQARGCGECRPAGRAGRGRACRVGRDRPGAGQLPTWQRDRWSKPLLYGDRRRLVAALAGTNLLGLLRNSEQLLAQVLLYQGFVVKRRSFGAES